MAYTVTEFGKQSVQLNDEDSCAQCGKDFDFDVEDDGTVSMSIPEEWNGKNFCSSRCKSEYWFSTLNREKQRPVLKILKAMFAVIEEDFSPARDAFRELGVFGEFAEIISSLEEFVNEFNEEDYPTWLVDEVKR